MARRKSKRQREQERKRSAAYWKRRRQEDASLSQQEREDEESENDNPPMLRLLLLLATLRSLPQVKSHHVYLQQMYLWKEKRWCQRLIPTMRRAIQGGHWEKKIPTDPQQQLLEAHLAY